ncbi:ubiquitin-like small modifier protein 1 [Haloprofundus halobius]|uniref:ubiquitin-like small modifier protein 1 n=1 Tax=Haloprofundus halobius TaxID=2876194 RepID=UPI001CCF3255|nr:ubiquitin-like small modifier protein 1 [Haloprofundus halobius]
MQWKLFADLAETAGGRTVSVDADCETVGDALDALLSARPALEARVLDDDGEVRDHINVLRNGENVSTSEGLDTPVADGDELALFPPVSGG